VVPVIGDRFAFFLGSAPGAVSGDALRSGAVPDAAAASTGEDLCSGAIVTGAAVGASTGKDLCSAVIVTGATAVHFIIVFIVTLSSWLLVHFFIVIIITLSSWLLVHIFIVILFTFSSWLFVLTFFVISIKNIRYIYIR